MTELERQKLQCQETIKAQRAKMNRQSAELLNVKEEVGTLLSGDFVGLPVLLLVLRIRSSCARRNCPAPTHAQSFTQFFLILYCKSFGLFHCLDVVVVVVAVSRLMCVLEAVDGKRKAKETDAAGPAPRSRRETSYSRGWC